MENISLMGVVRARNARQENPPIILASTSIPRLKPSAVTDRFNMPKFKIGSLIPKNRAMKMNVIKAKITGIAMNFK